MGDTAHRKIPRRPSSRKPQGVCRYNPDGRHDPAGEGLDASSPVVGKNPTFASFDALEQTRQAQQVSLALLRPKRLERLEITAVDNPEWTDEELTKLSQEQSQGNLFSEDEQRKQLKLLEKMPFDFHYHYLCDTPEGERAYRHKIVDWEVAMLFRNCRKSHGDGWECRVRRTTSISLPA